jgi:hypothetical protein
MFNSPVYIAVASGQPSLLFVVERFDRLVRPVEALEGIAARPFDPLSSKTSTSTVGFRACRGFGGR